MKNIGITFGLVCLLIGQASAQTNNRALKLTGIISMADVKCALLEIPAINRPAGWSTATLRERQREKGVEVLRISASESVVEVSDNGQKSSLSFATGEKHQTDQNADGRVEPTVQLRDASVAQVLDLYGELGGRTLLLHPAIKAGKVSFQTQARTKVEVASALERLFEQQGLAVIPDGDKFVMIVPGSLTNSALPRSDKIALESASDSSTNAEASIPRGQINIMGAEMGQVLPLYGDLIGRKFNRADSQYFGASIRFRSTTPLTKAEAVYALETLIGWSGLEIVPIDDKEFKVVPAKPAR